MIRHYRKKEPLNDFRKRADIYFGAITDLHIFTAKEDMVMPIKAGQVVMMFLPEGDHTQSIRKLRAAEEAARIIEKAGK